MAINFTKKRQIVGLSFGMVRFQGEVGQGSSHRTGTIDFPAEQILQLADSIRACHECYEDPTTGQRPRDLKQTRTEPRFRPTWIGHAIWHLDHPTRPAPCPINTNIVPEDSHASDLAREK